MLQPLHFEQHAIHHHHHPDRPLYGERLHHLEDGRARHGAARVHDAEDADVEDLLHRAFVLYSDALRVLIEGKALVLQRWAGWLRWWSSVVCAPILNYSLLSHHILDSPGRLTLFRYLPSRRAKRSPLPIYSSADCMRVPTHKRIYNY